MTFDPFSMFLDTARVAAYVYAMMKPQPDDVAFDQLELDDMTNKEIWTTALDHARAPDKKMRAALHECQGLLALPDIPPRAVRCTLWANALAPFLASFGYTANRDVLVAFLSKPGGIEVLESHNPRWARPFTPAPLSYTSARGVRGLFFGKIPGPIAHGYGYGPMGLPAYKGNPDQIKTVELSKKSERLWRKLGTHLRPAPPLRPQDTPSGVGGMLSAWAAKMDSAPISWSAVDLSSGVLVPADDNMDRPAIAV